MSKLKSFIKKRRKKEELDLPNIFNGFYQFNHENVINESKTTENPLKGCDISDTLYFEGEIKTSNYSFILTGKYGCSIFSAIQNRLEENIPSSLILAQSSDFEKLQIKNPFIDLPTLSIEESTFSQGVKWFKNNREKIINQLDRSIQNASILFLFCENNAFTFGLISRMLEYVQGKNMPIVAFMHIPVENTDITQQFSILTFIHYLMDKESGVNIPFVFMDENNLIKAKPNVPIEILQRKLHYREANVLLDLLLALENPSNFYQIDFSNFTRIFEDTKGPCNLLSFDIYDDKSDLSYLFGNRESAETFAVEEVPTRGFLSIQPGPKSISTKEYHSIRQIFSNLDVNFSINKKRTSGSLIRGLFTYNELPKTLLHKYNLFSDIVIELMDINKNPTGVFDLSKISKIWKHDYYRVLKYVETQES